MPRKVDLIVIHCSDSAWGDANVIDEWHKERGWNGIGYHFVILNGHRTAGSEYDIADDGLLELGRPLDMIGAHVSGKNAHSIGICLIGIKDFTQLQLQRMKSLVGNLKDNYGNIAVVGHYELLPKNSLDKKTCPNIDMNFLRQCILNV